MQRCCAPLAAALSTGGYAYSRRRCPRVAAPVGRRCSCKRHHHGHRPYGNCPLLAVATVSSSLAGGASTCRQSSCGCRTHSRPPACGMLPPPAGGCPHLLQPGHGQPPSFLAAFAMKMWLEHVE
ncbi:hypothetical protein BHM03_00050276 [Ensete ventricosum]|nr:hypothetical protein BHM03_00050276 [Ensete ventricosum]